MPAQRRHGPLAVHEYGDPAKPVLLVLHGLTDSGQCWGDLVARLGASYRVVAPDAMGHGDSARFTPTQLESGEAMELMYAATEGLLADVAPAGGALLLGHSMGGGVAAALAARRPDIVRAAVLEDPVWLDEPADGQPDEEAAEWVRETRAAAADPAITIAHGRRDHPTWPEVELAPWAHSKTDVDLRFLGTGRAMLETPWREIANAIEKPTLVVTGDHDVILDDAAVAGILALGNPAIEVGVVAGTGHCVRAGPARVEAGSAPGDRRDDADLHTLWGLAGETVEEAHVVVAHVDVDEATQLTGVVEHPRSDAVVVGLEVLEHLGEGRALRGDLGGTAGVVAQDRGDPDVDAHLTPRNRGCGQCSTVVAHTTPELTKAAYDGSMVAAGPTWPEIASRVFRPMPVLITTVSCAGSS